MRHTASRSALFNRLAVPAALPMRGSLLFVALAASLGSGGLVGCGSDADLQESVSKSQSALATWNNTSMASQTGVFTATFYATPTAAGVNEDSFIGFSHGAASAFTH